MAPIILNLSTIEFISIVIESAVVHDLWKYQIFQILGFGVIAASFFAAEKLPGTYVNIRDGNIILNIRFKKNLRGFRTVWTSGMGVVEETRLIKKNKDEWHTLLDFLNSRIPARERTIMMWVVLILRKADNITWLCYLDTWIFHLAEMGQQRANPFQTVASKCFQGYLPLLFKGQGWLGCHSPTISIGWDENPFVEPFPNDSEHIPAGLSLVDMKHLGCLLWQRFLGRIGLSLFGNRQLCQYWRRKTLNRCDIFADNFA
jgi:hypothetical protein